MMGLIALFFTAFIASLVATWVLREIAIQKSWLAQPREDRWHTKPTALHGGVAFYPVFFVLYVVAFFQSFSLFDHFWLDTLRENEPVRQSIALLAGSSIMFLLGWLDDIRGFRPVTKLLFQLIAASFFMAAGGVIPLTDITLFNIAITYFWFVGIINAINMLDNMDGLSSGVVCIGALSLLLLMAQASGDSNVMGMSAAILLVAVLCGFLVFNFPPAGIFMGDSGSLSIGYILAALAIPGSFNGLASLAQSESLLTPVIVFLISATVLAVPILDTTLVTLTRKWRAQKASQGGRDHASHRLVILGFSQKNTLWILYSLAIFSGIMALVMQVFPGYAILVFGGFALALIFFGIYLGNVKVRDESQEEKKAGWVPIINELVHKQRVAEISLDLVLIIGCYYSANLLRFGGDISDELNALITESMPAVIAATLVAFLMAGVYRTHWRMISLTDLVRYFSGVAGGVVLSLFSVVMLNRFAVGQSRSAFVIYGILLFLAVVATRISFRLFDQFVHSNREISGNESLVPVLIYGAGHAGKLLAHEISYSPDYKDFYLQGYMDDDPNKQGKELAGKSIKLPDGWSAYLEKQPVEIWISSSQISDQQVHDWLNQFEEELVVRRLNLSVDLLD